MILGGGPAGLIAAAGLARRGWAVTVLTVPRPPAVEGLSARVLEGLHIAGCQAALAVIGPPVPRHVYWNGGAVSVNREHLVDRTALDAALARDAEAAGAQICAERVGAVAAGPGGWTVTTSDRDGGRHRRAAPFLVEARGRAAPAGARQGAQGPDSIAVTGYWPAAPSASGLTAVASFRAGWAWFARRETGAVLTLIVSGARGDIPPRARLPEFYARAVGEIPWAADWLSGAAAPESLQVRAATSRFVRPVIGGNWLRLGDAAFTIDPLSGHGVYEAVRAALTVPALINTLWHRPEDAILAQRFHTDRAADAFARHARAGQALYAMERRWPAQPFWAERAAPARHADPIAPRAPTRAAVETRPVLDHDWIVPRPVLVTPAYPLGLRRIEDGPPAGGATSA